MSSINCSSSPYLLISNRAIQHTPHLISDLDLISNLYQPPQNDAGRQSSNQGSNNSKGGGKGTGYSAAADAYALGTNKFLLAKKSSIDAALKDCKDLKAGTFVSKRTGCESLSLSIITDPDKPVLLCTREYQAWINDRCQTKRDWVKRCNRTGVDGRPACQYKHGADSWTTDNIVFNFSFPESVEDL